MKRIISCLLILAMVFALAGCSIVKSKSEIIYEGANVPEDIEKVKIEMGSGDREFLVGNCHVYIHDDAKLLSGVEQEKLLGVVAKYAEKISFNILFLTYDDAQGKSTMTYSDDYMDNLFPYKAHDNIAFVIDMDNRQYYINTMGKAIEWLDAEEIDEALDKGYDYIADENYVRCLQAVSDYCLKELAREQSKQK